MRIRIVTARGPDQAELRQDVLARDWSADSAGAFMYHPVEGAKAVFVPWHIIRRVEVDPQLEPKIGERQ